MSETRNVNSSAANIGDWDRGIAPPPETPEETPETIRCTKCGRECAPIADDDSPATHCVDCTPQPTEGA